MDAVLLPELRTLIARHAEPLVARKLVGGLVVAAADRPTPLFAHVVEPVFSLVAQGAKRILLGERTFDYAAGRYLIASVDLPVSGQITQASADAPFLGLSLLLKPDLMASLLLETGTPRQSEAELQGVAVSTLTEDLLEPIVRLLRLLDRPDDIPVLAPAIEREIYWRLLHGEQGAMIRQLGLADSRMAQISRAIRWIREHFAEALRVEELAEFVGMSVTSFHRHFLRVTSFSPLQFQKQIRLQEARTRLQSSSNDVATVGFEVGYGSPSQFSREYRRMFGVPPGRDSRRERQA